MVFRSPGPEDERQAWLLAEIRAAQKKLDKAIAEAESLSDSDLSKTARITRYNNLRSEVDVTMDTLIGKVKLWSDTDLGDMYKDGLNEATVSLGYGASGFTLPHREAISVLSYDAFDDIGTNLQQVSDNFGKTLMRQSLYERLDARQLALIQEESKSEIAQALLTGNADPRKVARRLAKDLWAENVQIIDSAGKRWKMDTYTRMLVRTKSANAYNAGSLNKYVEEGIERVQVFDGTEDDIGCIEANGQIWTIAYASQNVIQHPNCRRAFGPVRGNGATDKGDSQTKVALSRFDDIAFVASAVFAIRNIGQPGEADITSTLAKIVIEVVESFVGVPIVLFDDVIVGALSHRLPQVDQWIREVVTPALAQLHVGRARFVRELPPVFVAEEIQTYTEGVVEYTANAVIKAYSGYVGVAPEAANTIVGAARWADDIVSQLAEVERPSALLPKKARLLWQYYNPTRLGAALGEVLFGGVLLKDALAFSRTMTAMRDAQKDLTLSVSHSQGDLVVLRSALNVEVGSIDSRIADGVPGTRFLVQHRDNLEKRIDAVDKELAVVKKIDGPITTLYFPKPTDGFVSNDGGMTNLNKGMDAAVEEFMLLVAQANPAFVVPVLEAIHTRLAGFNLMIEMMNAPQTGTLKWEDLIDMRIFTADEITYLKDPNVQQVIKDLAGNWTELNDQNENLRFDMTFDNFGGALANLRSERNALLNEMSGTISVIDSIDVPDKLLSLLFNDRAVPAIVNITGIPKPSYPTITDDHEAAAFAGGVSSFKALFEKTLVDIQRIDGVVSAVEHSPRDLGAWLVGVTGEVPEFVSGGANGSTYFIEVGGRKLLVKNQTRVLGVNGKWAAALSNRLSSWLGDTIGVPVPQAVTVPVGPRRGGVVSYVTLVNAVDASGTLFDAFVDPSWTRPLVLYDMLTQEDDGHGGNYLVSPGGTVMSIDNEASFRFQNSSKMMVVAHPQSTTVHSIYFDGVSREIGDVLAGKKDTSQYLEDVLPEGFEPPHLLSTEERAYVEHDVYPSDDRPNQTRNLVMSKYTSGGIPLVSGSTKKNELVLAVPVGTHGVTMDGHRSTGGERRGVLASVFLTPEESKFLSKLLSMDLNREPEDLVGYELFDSLRALISETVLRLDDRDVKIFTETIWDMVNDVKPADFDDAVNQTTKRTLERMASFMEEMLTTGIVNGAGDIRATSVGGTIVEIGTAYSIQTPDEVVNGLVMSIHTDKDDNILVQVVDNIGVGRTRTQLSSTHTPKMVTVKADDSSVTVLAQFVPDSGETVRLRQVRELSDITAAGYVAGKGVSMRGAATLTKHEVHIPRVTPVTGAYDGMHAIVVFPDIPSDAASRMTYSVRVPNPNPVEEEKLQHWTTVEKTYPSLNERDGLQIFTNALLNSVSAHLRPTSITFKSHVFDEAGSEVAGKTVFGRENIQASQIGFSDVKGVQIEVSLSAAMPTGQMDPYTNAIVYPSGPQFLEVLKILHHEFAHVVDVRTRDLAYLVMRQNVLEIAAGEIGVDEVVSLTAFDSWASVRARELNVSLYPQDEPRVYQAGHRPTEPDSVTIITPDGIRLGKNSDRQLPSTAGEPDEGLSESERRRDASRRLAKRLTEAALLRTNWTRTYGGAVGPRFGPELDVAPVARYDQSPEFVEELRVFGATVMPVYELPQTPAGAQVYLDAVLKAKAAAVHGASVDAHTVEEFTEMRLFLMGEAGDAGIAISKDGQLISGFNGSKDIKRALHTLIPLGIAEGGVRADAFDTVLPGFYAEFGLQPVARVRFSPEFAPEGWDYDVFRPFNNGQPDIVFLQFDRNRIGVPYEPGDGRMISDYDDALELTVPDDGVDLRYVDVDTPEPLPVPESLVPEVGMAYDLTINLPDDVYDNWQLYFGASDQREKVMLRETMDILEDLRGKPDAEVRVYRAVSSSVKEINTGDWVTVSRRYADDHGDRSIGEGYVVLEAVVKARDLTFSGDWLPEFGYFPDRAAAREPGDFGDALVSILTERMVDSYDRQAEWVVNDLFVNVLGTGPRGSRVNVSAVPGWLRPTFDIWDLVDERVGTREVIAAVYARGLELLMRNTISLPKTIDELLDTIADDFVPLADVTIEGEENAFVVVNSIADIDVQQDGNYIYHSSNVEISDSRLMSETELSGLEPGWWVDSKDVEATSFEEEIAHRGDYIYGTQTPNEDYGGRFVYEVKVLPGAEYGPFDDSLLPEKTEITRRWVLREGAPADYHRVRRALENLLDVDPHELAKLDGLDTAAMHKWAVDSFDYTPTPGESYRSKLTELLMADDHHIVGPERVKRIEDIMARERSPFISEDYLEKTYTFTDPVTGYYAEPTSVVVHSSENASVRGRLFDANGHEIGDFTRGVEADFDGDITVQHDTMFIRSVSAQGTGFGQRFSDHMEEYYIARGVSRITLGTADVGKYYWARRGFDFESAYSLPVQFSDGYEVFNDNLEEMLVDEVAMESVWVDDLSQMLVDEPDESQTEFVNRMLVNRLTTEQHSRLGLSFKDHRRYIDITDKFDARKLDDFRDPVVTLLDHLFIDLEDISDRGKVQLSYFLDNHDELDDLEPDTQEIINWLFNARLHTYETFPSENTRIVQLLNDDTDILWESPLLPETMKPQALSNFVSGVLDPIHEMMRDGGNVSMGDFVGLSEFGEVLDDYMNDAPNVFANLPTEVREAVDLVLGRAGRDPSATDLRFSRVLLDVDAEERVSVLREYVDALMVVSNHIPVFGGKVFAAMGTHMAAHSQYFRHEVARLAQQPFSEVRDTVRQYFLSLNRDEKVALYLEMQESGIVQTLTEEGRFLALKYAAARLDSGDWAFDYGSAYELTELGSAFKIPDFTITTKPVEAWFGKAMFLLSNGTSYVKDLSFYSNPSLIIVDNTGGLSEPFKDAIALFGGDFNSVMFNHGVFAYTQSQTVDEFGGVHAFGGDILNAIPGLGALVAQIGDTWVAHTAGVAHQATRRIPFIGALANSLREPNPVPLAPWSTDMLVALNKVTDLASSPTLLDEAIGHVGDAFADAYSEVLFQFVGFSPQVIDVGDSTVSSTPMFAITGHDIDNLQEDMVLIPPNMLGRVIAVATDDENPMMIIPRGAVFEYIGESTVENTEGGSREVREFWLLKDITDTFSLVAPPVEPAWNDFAVYPSVAGDSAMRSRVFAGVFRAAGAGISNVNYPIPFRILDAGTRDVVYEGLLLGDEIRTTADDLATQYVSGSKLFNSVTDEWEDATSVGGVLITLPKQALDGMLLQLPATQPQPLPVYDTVVGKYPIRLIKGDPLPTFSENVTLSTNAYATYFWNMLRGYMDTDTAQNNFGGNALKAYDAAVILAETVGGMFAKIWEDLLVVVDDSVWTNLQSLPQGPQTQALAGVVDGVFRRTLLGAPALNTHPGQLFMVGNGRGTPFRGTGTSDATANVVLQSMDATSLYPNRVSEVSYETVVGVHRALTRATAATHGFGADGVGVGDLELDVDNNNVVILHKVIEHIRDNWKQFYPFTNDYDETLVQEFVSLFADMSAELDSFVQRRLPTEASMIETISSQVQWYWWNLMSRPQDFGGSPNFAIVLDRSDFDSNT